MNLFSASPVHPRSCFCPGGSGGPAFSLPRTHVRGHGGSRRCEPARCAAPGADGWKIHLGIRAGGYHPRMVPVGNWFCLRAQPKSEHIAAAHLKRMEGVKVFLPRVRFQRATRQGRVWVTEALFPGQSVETWTVTISPFLHSATTSKGRQQTSQSVLKR